MTRVSGRHLFTSESVTEGHPDKMADQISDALLDAMLARDPNCRVACETALTTGLAFVMGEVTCAEPVDIPRIVRETILDIGYSGEAFGFDGRDCSVLVALDEQSPDIARGVDRAADASTQDEIPALGAGDQGMMFGFACRETRELMPLPISLAHRLARRLAEARRSGELPYLGPDGKTQVTVLYDGFTPLRVESVVVSAQHLDEVPLERLRADVLDCVVRPTIPDSLLRGDVHYYVNPTGRFVLGGPRADSGLTGRKIIVDTYGGYARHGGGAFSGKDPTKVDRSGAYAARYVAKNVVAAGLAERCEVQVAYVIGLARPVSLRVDTFGTGIVGDDAITRLVEEHFDLRPGAVIRDLDLRRPIYRRLATYGHFGRSDLNPPWERIDRAAALRDAAGLGSLSKDPLAEVAVADC